MKQSHRTLREAFVNVLARKQNAPEIATGLMGTYISGSIAIAVPDRKGYVYVRLRGDVSETIEAFNDQVKRSYDLPVLLVKEGSKYTVVGKNTTVYSEWPDMQPDHGDQHSFSGGTGTYGSDIVWVAKRQFIPMVLSPTNPQSMRAYVQSDFYAKSTSFGFFGGTGTADFTSSVPASVGDARMMTVYFDIVNGVLGYLTGTVFSSLTTPTDPTPYTPMPTPQQGMPLGAVYLYNGQIAISWDNLYDVRPIVGGGNALAPLALNATNQTVYWLGIDWRRSGSAFAGIWKPLLTTPDNEPVQSASANSAGAADLIMSFITEYPIGSALLYGGIVSLVITASQVGGNSSRLYFKVYSKRIDVQFNPNTLLGTSSETVDLTGSNVSYTLTAAMVDTIIDPVQSYLFIEVYAHTTGGTNTVTIQWDGATQARVTLPAASISNVLPTPTRGDLLKANSTPSWDVLHVGATGTHLMSNGLDPVWSAIPTQYSKLLGVIHTDTTPETVLRGDIIAGKGVSPTWDSVHLGASGTVLTSDGLDALWLVNPGANHNLLSSTHPDTVPGSVTRGSIIRGNSSPAWEEYNLGASGTVLTSSGLDAVWAPNAGGGGGGGATDVLQVQVFS